MKFSNFIIRVKNKIVYLLYKLQGKQIIHFMHVGKTGGSAVKNAIKEYLITDDYVIYSYSHDFTLRHVPDGDKTIFFLRDPVTRFVSGFYSRKRQGLPRQLNPWSSDEKTAFNNFDSPNQLALALSSKNLIEKEKAEHAMKSIGHVRNLYWEWFENADYLCSREPDILFIGFQETLTEDFEILKLKLNLPKNLMLSNDEKASHRTPEHMDKSLENEAIINLQKWYKDDYKVIDICNNMRNANV